MSGYAITVRKEADALHATIPGALDKARQRKETAEADLRQSRAALDGARRSGNPAAVQVATEAVQVSEDERRHAERLMALAKKRLADRDAMVASLEKARSRGETDSFLVPVEGDVRRTGADGNAIPDPSAPLLPGQKIETGRDGKARLFLGHGDVDVRLGESASFEIVADSDYRRYLEVAPAAEDAPRIRDEIVKIEFRMERQTAEKSRAGTWVSDDGAFYKLSVDGNRITLHTDARPITEQDVKATYPVAGSIPLREGEKQTFRLDARGNKLSGTWSRLPIKAEMCTVPAEGGDVAGEIVDAKHLIVVRYARSSYLARTGMGVLTNDYCAEVQVVAKRDLETRLFGPSQGGWIGVGVDIHDEPGRILIKIGWKGHLSVPSVAGGSTADSVGLRNKDEILAIDGVEVKTLTAGEALWRLSGAPGSEVKLLVLHRKEKEPVALSLRRVELPQPKQK